MTTISNGARRGRCDDMAGSINLVSTYRIADNTTDPDMVSERDFCLLFQEDRGQEIQEYLNRARSGEQVVTFELLRNGDARLLILQANTDVDICLIAQLVQAEGIGVPEHLASRVLGIRASAIHQICNDLSAARLNSELAEKILQSEHDAVDLRVMDALRSVIRLSATVETRLRDLQGNVKFNLHGTKNDE